MQMGSKSTWNLLLSKKLGFKVKIGHVGTLDRLRGFPRFWREFLGTVICPIKGLNRILSGDAWRVRGRYYKYHDYGRSPVSFSASAGYRYLADNNTLFRGEGNPYVRFNLVYGDPFDGATT